MSLEKTVDNKTTRKFLKKMAEKDDAVYTRYQTEMFMRIFWVGAILLLFVVRFQLVNGCGIQSHFVTFIAGTLALAGYQLIDPFLDTAEECGLIIPEEELEDETESESESESDEE